MVGTVCRGFREDEIMRLAITLEADGSGDCADATVEMDDERTRLELRQGDDSVWLDRGQRDELVKALDMLPFPDEDVEFEYEGEG